MSKEDDCMKKMSACFYILRELWGYGRVYYLHTVQYYVTQEKTASWVHSGLCSNVRDPTVLVVDLFCRWMLPMFLFFLFSCFGAEGMALPSLLYQGTPHSTSTPSPLLTSSSTTCLHSVVSLGSPSPLPFPLLSIMPSRALPLPWPIEGRMRKTERMSRVPHGAVCTITCTAFTCPVSTAVAPATVAKLACPLQPTLSAMPPSLNTCELAPTAS